ncbi:MAG: molybdopterin-dependent oxidoreductase, partial [Nonomuraea sp.]|nr:molybdopterin-dependent oxidoreductase [Nonomuraea sp.]
MGASQVNQVLLTLYTEARKGLEPVSAWAKLTGNSEVFQVGRGQPRTAVDDRTAAELVSAAIVHTLAAHGREGVAALGGSPLAGVIGNVLDEPPIPGPRRADWARSAYVVLWGAQGRRSPGVPWVIAGRYKGQKVVAIGPHPARLSDETLVVRQGTDAALAMAVGHVLLKEFFLDRPVFTGGDLSYLVRLRDGAPLGHPDGVRDTGETAEVLLPRSEGALWRGVRVVRAGGEAATTVLDLLFALYGVARDGLPGRWPSGYDDRSEPYTPAWQEGVTGVTASRAVKLARELGVTAEKTGGQCVIMPGSLAPEAVTALLALLAMTGGGWALPPAPRVL